MSNTAERAQLNVRIPARSKRLLGYMAASGGTTQTAYVEGLIEADIVRHATELIADNLKEIQRLADENEQLQQYVISLEDQ